MSRSSIFNAVACVRSPVRVIAIGVLALIAASCGSTGGQDSAERAVSRALVEELSPCPPLPEGEHIDGAPAAPFLAEADEWLRLVGLPEARSADTEVRSTVSLVTVETPRGASGSTADVKLWVHFSYWPGIDWALANGATIDVASRNEDLADGGVGRSALAALVEPIDGVPFFVGECAQETLFGGLEAQLGDTVYDVLRALPDMTKSEAEVSLGVAS